jgi:deoxyribonuclease-4
MTVRVRQILSALNSVERTELKKLLPPSKTIKAPEEPEGTKYPAALLSALGVAVPGEGYSLLGFITEDLVGLPPVEIILDRLIAVTKERCPSLTADLEEKIRKSKTNDPFLEHLRATRKKFRFAARGDIRHEETVGNALLEGHPDFRTATQVFEVKMTGQLSKNWQDFLYQVFAYAALAPEITDIYLVLPLQEIVWHHDVRSWSGREAYKAYLEAAITKKLTAVGPAQELVETCHIGSHMHKLKSLVDTVNSLPTDRPSQIFLCGPQSSKLNIADAELVATGQAVAARGVQLFIHSPYIINLCTSASAENDAYHTKLLIKNLQYGVIIGARGVVVHVGKSTNQEMAAAVATMKANMLEAMQHATPACPILLETPAGQGSEVLLTQEAFAGFVADINDSRLRVCIDTCHVFACGHQPLDYIKKTGPAVTKLLHFNDSAAPCGSCVDRHAAIGQGHIGIADMTQIAHYAISHGLPMVIE